MGAQATQQRCKKRKKNVIMRYCGALDPRLSSRDDSPSKSGGKGGREGEREERRMQILIPAKKGNFLLPPPPFRYSLLLSR